MTQLKLLVLLLFFGSFVQAQVINTYIISRDGIAPTSDRYWGQVSTGQDDCQGKKAFDDSKCRQRRLLDWMRQNVADLTRRTVTVGLTYGNLDANSRAFSTAYDDKVLDVALYPGGENLVKYVWSNETEAYVNKSAFMYCRSQNYSDIFSYQTVDSAGVGWGLQFTDSDLDSVAPPQKTRSVPQVYIGIVGCTNNQTDLSLRTSKTFSWPLNTPHVRVDGRAAEQGLSAGVREFPGGPVTEAMEKSTISNLDVHVAARLFCKRMRFDDAVTSEAWALENYQEVVAFTKDADPRDQSALGDLILARTSGVGQLKAVTCANQPKVVPPIQPE